MTALVIGLVIFWVVFAFAFRVELNRSWYESLLWPSYALTAFMNGAVIQMDKEKCAAQRKGAEPGSGK